MFVRGRCISIALVALTCFSCASAGDGREAGISLQQTLTASEPVSIPFTAKRSGPHDLILDFTVPIADREVRDLIERAGATTGEAQAPDFDFTWQVISDARVIAERSSPQRSEGVIQTGTSGLGGGPLTRTGLTFGAFNLTAGAVYTLRIVPGAGFRAIVASKPDVLVEHRVRVYGNLIRPVAAKRR